jgi:hypothetical protein
MRVGAQIPLKTFLRGVVLSRPVRGISEWLHADPDAEKAPPPPAKICFIHVPKTGGTFVTQRENRDQTVVFPMQDLNHATLVNKNWEVLRDVPAPFGEANALPLSAVDDLIVFSNARNIFSFFVSYFHHAAGHVER